jgi:hypothetical protein
MQNLNKILEISRKNSMSVKLLARDTIFIENLAHKSNIDEGLLFVMVLIIFG